MFSYDNLSKIGIKVVRFFFIIFALLFAVGNLFITVRVDNLISNEVNYEYGVSISVLLVFVILVVLLVIFIKNNYFNINEKVFLGIFLVMALVVSVYWLVSNDYHLVNYDDAYNVYMSAVSLIKYDFSVVGRKTYINMYPNNLGLLTYDFILIKFFGEIGSLYAFRIINIVFMLLGYFYLYKITDILFKNRVINCTLIYLMFFSGQFIFYTFFAYGNCLSYSLSIISVYYLIKYIKQKKVWSSFLSVICIIISITIKMNSVIVLIAELIYLFHHFIKDKNIIIIIAVLISLLGTYLGTTGIQNFWAKKGQIDYKDTKLPLICWIAYGMNYDDSNPGHYFPEFEHYHWANEFDQEYTSTEANRYINEAVTFFTENPLNGINYYFKKFIASWANPQFEAFDQYRDSELTDLNKNIIGEKINSCIEYIWDATLSIVAIGIILFIFINKKERNIINYIGCVIVIGGFLFHAFWEVKAIYLYQYYMYLLPYAAYGFTFIIQNKIDK